MVLKGLQLVMGTEELRRLRDLKGTTGDQGDRGLRISTFCCQANGTIRTDFVVTQKTHVDKGTLSKMSVRQLQRALLFNLHLAASKFPPHCPLKAEV